MIFTIIGKTSNSSAAPDRYQIHLKLAPVAGEAFSFFPDTIGANRRG
jgi:hypothetical protein